MSHNIGLIGVLKGLGHALNKLQASLLLEIQSWVGVQILQASTDLKGDIVTVNRR